MEYAFSTTLWKYAGQAAWYFLTLPSDYTAELKMLAAPHGRGFGSIKVTAYIGRTSWETSIFPDSKSGSYLLPIKKEIRVKNNLEEGDKVDCKLRVAFGEL